MSSASPLTDTTILNKITEESNETNIVKPQIQILNVSNGIITLKIPNTSQVMKETLTVPMITIMRWYQKCCNLIVFIANPDDDHKITSNSDNNDHDNYKWQEYNKELAKNHECLIKVPFYLKPYEIMIKVQLTWKYDSSIHKSLYYSPISDIETVTIPPVSIHPEYKINDLVTYRVKNAQYVHHARITKILDGSERDESGYTLDYEIQDAKLYNYDKIPEAGTTGIKSILKVNADRTLYKTKYPIDNMIDTCSLLDKKTKFNIHRFNAECDLVLGTKDEKIRQYFWMLRNLFAEIYQSMRDNEKFLIPKIEKCTQPYEYNFYYFGAQVSDIVTKYIYFDEMNKNDKKLEYKMRCFKSDHSLKRKTIDGYDVGYMFMKNQWKYQIDSSINSSQRGLSSLDIQHFTNSGWSCGTCYSTINVYDWISLCLPTYSIEHSSDCHGFCLQCTYSIANEIVKFEKNLKQIIIMCIDEKFPIDCIKEIVAYVIGSVTKS